MDPKFVENILESLSQTEAKYFKMESSNQKIEIVRSKPELAKIPLVHKERIEPEKPNNEELVEKTFDITSPYIGFFQRSETKGGKPLVKLREMVEEGKVVAYIRSMNLQYEVPANVKGKIAEVLVEDGQAVEYGQPLFRLKLT